MKSSASCSVTGSTGTPSTRTASSRTLLAQHVRDSFEHLVGAKGPEALASRAPLRCSEILEAVEAWAAGQIEHYRPRVGALRTPGRRTGRPIDHDARTAQEEGELC